MPQHNRPPRSRGPRQSQRSATRDVIHMYSTPATEIEKSLITGNEENDYVEITLSFGLTNSGSGATSGATIQKRRSKRSRRGGNGNGGNNEKDHTKNEPRSIDKRNNVKLTTNVKQSGPTPSSEMSSVGSVSTTPFNSPPTLTKEIIPTNTTPMAQELASRRKIAGDAVVRHLRGSFAQRGRLAMTQGIARDATITSPQSPVMPPMSTPPLMHMPIPVDVSENVDWTQVPTPEPTQSAPTIMPFSIMTPTTEPRHQRSSYIGYHLPISTRDLPETKPFPLAAPKYSSEDLPIPTPYNPEYPHPLTIYASPGVNPATVDASGYAPLLRELIHTDPRLMLGSILAECGKKGITAPGLMLEPENKDGCGIPEKYWLRLSTWAGVKVPLGAVAPFARSSSRMIAPRFLANSVMSLEVISSNPTNQSGYLHHVTARSTQSATSDRLFFSNVHSRVSPICRMDKSRNLRHAHSATELQPQISRPSQDHYSALGALGRRHSEVDLLSRLRPTASLQVFPHDVMRDGQANVHSGHPGICSFRDIRYQAPYHTVSDDRRQAENRDGISDHESYHNLDSLSRYSCRRPSAIINTLSTVEEMEDDTPMSVQTAHQSVEAIGAERRQFSRTDLLITPPSHLADFQDSPEYTVYNLPPSSASDNCGLPPRQLSSNRSTTSWRTSSAPSASRFGGSSLSTSIDSLNRQAAYEIEFGGIVSPEFYESPEFDLLGSSVHYLKTSPCPNQFTPQLQMFQRPPTPRTPHQMVFDSNSETPTISCHISPPKNCVSNNIGPPTGITSCSASGMLPANVDWSTVPSTSLDFSTGKSIWC